MEVFFLIRLLYVFCGDRQPLLDALPACGSENCILLLCDLIQNRDIEADQAQSYLTSFSLIPRPSPRIIHSINVRTITDSLTPDLNYRQV